MKTQINLIFRSLILITFIAVVSCKQAEEKSAPTQEPVEEIDYEAYQSAVADTVRMNNGAVIQLEIKDADALFNSEEPSIIGEGSPDLAFIGMKSQGKPGDDSSTNDTIDAKQFISSVYVGKQAVWMISPRAQGDYKFTFQEIDLGPGEKPTPNGSEPCSAFVIKRALPENSGVIRTEVEENENLVGCKQPYSIIFSIHQKSSGKTRFFVLDPWVLIKP